MADHNHKPPRSHTHPWAATAACAWLAAVAGCMRGEAVATGSIGGSNTQPRPGSSGARIVINTCVFCPNNTYAGCIWNRAKIQVSPECPGDKYDVVQAHTHINVLICNNGLPSTLSSPRRVHIQHPLTSVTPAVPAPTHTRFLSAVISAQIVYIPVFLNPCSIPPVCPPAQPWRPWLHPPPP